jgi:tripartite-type tricarboxylate transporter receptor subunit TctC
VAGELFKSMTGVDMQQVPYRSGGEMVTALLGGQVHAIFISLPASIEYIRTGKLHPLAVTTLERSPALPNVPSVAEFVPGYESSIWTGISAPKRTPIEIIDRLNKEINAALAEPNMKAHLTDLGDVPMPMSPTEFGTFIADETDRWAKVIRAANIKAE